MKIKYLKNNKIIFDNKNGILMNYNPRYIDFINKNNICEIDTSSYDYIYKIYDKWCGYLLLIKDNKFRYIQCGSRIPFLLETEKNGILSIENLFKY